MRVTLKQIHPYLYARVRLKGIVNILLGLSLFFGDHLPSALSTKTAEASQLNYVLPFDVWGAVFIILGCGIMIGLRNDENNYELSKKFLSASLLYSLFWFVVLILTVIVGHPRTASIMILWGYWVYNQWLIRTDPAWGAVNIIKKANKENGR